MNKRVKWMVATAALCLLATRVFAFDVPFAGEAPVVDGDAGLGGQQLTQAIGQRWSFD